MNQLKKKIDHSPVYLCLLPVFFVLHVLKEHYSAGVAKEAITLGLKYLFFSIILAILFWFLYKNVLKASLVSFCLMAFHFFFGSAHDFLKQNFNDSIIIKYSFLVPIFVILFAALIIYLKRTKRNFIKLTSFLNWLFLLLIALDLVLLVPSIMSKKNHHVSLAGRYQPCDTCSRPDVYLIIADEYAGRKALTDLFSFDNSDFENALRTRDFHVVQNSTSNYNATVYSISSMLDMNYINNLESTRVNHRDMFICRDIINENNVLSFFKKKGYSIHNYSPFHLNNNNRAVSNPFFIEKKQLFTAQTFTKRIRTDLGYYFASQQEKEDLIRKNFLNNKLVYDLTAKAASKTGLSPKFIYTHFQLPHHPYFTDSNGKELPLEKLTPGLASNKDAYLNYLVYSNKMLLQLIDHIRDHSTKPPIIILASDHGFRQFTEKTDPKYQFMNLNAVHLPCGNYTLFYDGMSNVNQFRVILNAQFGQNLPLLKDSTSFLME